MSSRVLKKLQGGRDADLPPTNGLNDELSEEDKDDMERCRSNHLNPFDLLNQSLSESEFKEDDNETEHASAATNLPAVSGASKKKKKKRRKKAKIVGNHISSEDNEIGGKYLIYTKVGDIPAVAPRAKNDKSLLTVELRNLNSQNELRRTFGKRVVKIENKRGRQKLTFKNTYMVTAKETWPPTLKNIITMKAIIPEQVAMASSSVVTDKTNSFLPYSKEQWFAFEHSHYYQSIQLLFLSEISEPEYLMDLILRCPYHVDSLIQLNELCRLTEDYSLGADFVERALFVLEQSLHPSFSLTAGTSRLDYRRQENRAFFIVLFKHAVYLEERACSRTALELSKLVLSLSPDEDPLAMVLVIDYFALRSKQHTWFVHFYEEYDSVRNLSQLPNMAYSYALALFCLSDDKNDEMKKADNALQYALLMFPGILRKLLDVLSIQTDKRVLSCSYFNSDDSSSADGLNMLINLYIRRAKVIWRQTDMLPWLERNVNIVIDRLEHDDPVIVEYKQKRATRYMSPPQPILRHLVLSGDKIPPRILESLQKQNLAAFDPLPPLDSFNSYERNVKSSSSSPSNAPDRSFSIFFESVLPSFSIQPQNNQQPLEVQVQLQLQAQAQAQARAHNAHINANANLNPNQNPNPNPNPNGHANDDAHGNIAVVNEQQQQQRHRQRQRQQRVDLPPDEDDRIRMQPHNANLQNQIVEGAAASIEAGASYRELTQTLSNLLDAIRNRFRDVVLEGDEEVPDEVPDDANENRSSEEEIVVYLDDSSD